MLKLHSKEFKKDADLYLSNIAILRQNILSKYMLRKKDKLKYL